MEPGMYTEFLEKLDPATLAEFIGRIQRHPAAIIGKAGEFLWCNVAWSRALGFTIEELVRGFDLDRLTSGEDDLEVDRSQMARVINGLETEYEVVKHLVTKSGNRINVRLVFTRFPRQGDLNWIFVQGDVLGDEQKEAFRYATDQVVRLTTVFTEAHNEMKERLDRLIGQNEQALAGLQTSQWAQRAFSAGVIWAGEFAKANPVWTGFALMTLLTLSIGHSAVDTVREVAALFGIQLGSPAVQAIPVDLTIPKP